MSEAVSNAEIEDVLSAVRKLVSENAETEAQKEDGPTDQVTKLVLTPAFRVDDDPETSGSSDEDESQGSAEAPFAEMAEVVEAAGDAEADIINLNAHQSEGDAEHHSAPDQPEHLEVQAEDAQTEVEQPEMEQAETEQTEQSEADQETHAAAEQTAEEVTLAARIAELEAVVSRSSVQVQDEYEPDGSEEVILPEAVLERAEVDDDAAAQGAEIQDAGPQVDAPQEEAAAQVHEPQGETAEQDAEPEAADTGVQAQDWEDVDPAQTDDEPHVQAAAQDELLEAEPYDDDEDADLPESDPVGDEDLAAVAQDDADEGDDDEILIDEDMLRDIVSRIVREELQGPMGERITQNLRRLVRREIKRALATRGIE